MHYATTLSDVASVARRIFYPARDRHAALIAPIISLKTLLVAAVIAACVTLGIQWMHTAYGKADSILKAEENCCVFRSVPASAGSVLDSPFAQETRCSSCQSGLGLMYHARDKHLLVRRNDLPAS